MEVERGELYRPNADIHELFCHYNALYFNGALAACFVDWCPRISSSTGTCYYFYDRGRYCGITLSETLRKVHPTTNLKNILLHEMIHAFLWIKYRNKDHSDHGSYFQEKMKEINCSSLVDDQRPGGGYNITPHHEFKKDVNTYRFFHWICDTCGHMIKKITKPSANDCNQKVGPDGSCNNSKCDWHIHKNGCSGSYTRKSESPRYEDSNLDLKGGLQIQDGKPETFPHFTERSTGTRNETEGSKGISDGKKTFGIKTYVTTSTGAKRNSVDIGSPDDNYSKEFSQKQAKPAYFKTQQNSEGGKSLEFKRENNTVKKRRKSRKDLNPIETNFFDMKTLNHARAPGNRKGVRDVASKSKIGHTFKKRTRDGKFKERCTAVTKWRECMEAYKAAGEWFSLYGDEEDCDDVEPLRNKRSERRKRLKLLQSCYGRISTSEDETDDADRMEEDESPRQIKNIHKHTEHVLGIAKGIEVDTP